MTRDQAKKRMVRIEGKPLAPVFSPRTETRKETSKVENISDFDANEFDNFFDFEDDLMETESARKHFERTEMERIEYEFRQKALGLSEDPEEVEPTGFFIIEEPEEENEDIEIEEQETRLENLPTLVPVPIEELIIEVIDEFAGRVETPEDFNEKGYRICRRIRPDGSRCNRMAPQTSWICARHRK